MPEILSALVLGALGWFLWDSLKAREAANAAIRPACQAEQLLFLDDTVALESVWPMRDGDGRMRLRRIYRFEYSDDGDHRRKGSITLLGSAVDAIDLGPRRPPAGATLH